jgi:hypothetical protein
MKNPDCVIGSSFPAGEQSIMQRFPRSTDAMGFSAKISHQTQNFSWLIKTTKLSEADKSLSARIIWRTTDRVRYHLAEMAYMLALLTSAELSIKAATIGSSVKSSRLRANTQLDEFH